MSVTVEITDRGLDDAIAKMQALAAPDRLELMDSIGRLVQEQTRYRISTDKMGPDGSAWKPNRAGTSILYASHRLAESIDYRASLDRIAVGSPMVYAKIHQFGGVIKAKNGKALAFSSGGENYVRQSVTIPARPYLGLSAENVEELESVVSDFILAVLDGGDR